MELCMHENAVFFLAVNTHSVACWLSWPHNTLPCVLMYVSVCMCAYVFVCMSVCVRACVRARICVLELEQMLLQSFF